MNRSFLFVVAVVVLIANAPAQYAKGPKSGSVASGVTVTTNSFLPAGRVEFPGPLFAEPKNKISPHAVPAPVDIMAPSAPAGSNFMRDLSVTGITATRPPIPILSTRGIPDEAVLGFTYIPPDPYVAVGPDHILATVNTRFRIIDKAGNIIKTIAGDSWFSTTYPVSAANGVFDPKIIYDHYANRWVMVWLQQGNADSSSHFLISVSDDSDPTGTWYNWALPGNVVGDSVIGSWADYEGVGYDDKAIYLTSNQFRFSGSFHFTRLRIIPKAQLYANADPPGPVTWTDFWDLRDRGLNTVFGVRPSIMYTAGSWYPLVGMPNISPGSYFAVFAVFDPIGTPSIDVEDYPVTSWTSPSNAGQLGGGTLPLEAGGERVRFEPVYRDSSLWIVHSIASGTGNQFSSIRYVRINVLNGIVQEDKAFGADGFWYYYPGLVADKDRNIAITYSRSGNTEYAGAYMTFRLNTDPAGLRPSVTIKAGKANYVKDFSSGRNRWGDYNGVALDPADPSNFWMFTEYAESPANTWGTWFYGARLVPFPGKKVWATLPSISFGLLETGFTLDTSIVVFNHGDAPLTITGVSTSTPSYQLPGPVTFPALLNTYDSIVVHIRFAPVANGILADTVSIACDDPTTPVLRVAVTGTGILIGRAVPGTIYATSSGGQMFRIDAALGTATTIGPLGISDIQTLTIRPSTKELYGTYSTPTGTTLYRLSAGYGGTLFNRAIPVGNMRAIAFTLAGDTLYGATAGGRLYRIDLTTGDTVGIGTAAGTAYSSLAFNPVTGVLWGSVRPAVVGKDKIYTVSTSTGSATLVGATGFGSVNAGIAFDMLGNLYAVNGSGTTTNNFISINTATGQGTLIGSTSQTGLNAIVMRTDSLQTGVEQTVAAPVPSTYVLEQNYPNPFNPVTQIRYGLPHQSAVTLTVFNLVGQRVTTLFEGSQSAGFHEVTWDGRNQAGRFVASSVYIYRLEAHAIDGNSAQLFTETKKMLLLK